MRHRTRFNLIYSWPIFCFHSRCNPRLKLRQRPFASTCFTVYISFIFSGEVRAMSSCGFLSMWPIHLHLPHPSSLITFFITMLRWMATLFPFSDQVFHFEDLWFSSLKPLSSWKISYLFTQASYKIMHSCSWLISVNLDWIGCDFQSFIKFFTSFMSSSESLVHWLIFSVKAFSVFSLWYIKHSDLIIGPIIHKKCLRSLPSQKIPTICSPFLY